eukprot:9743193-Alexandrium_andersonii.AAC.1
MQRALKGFRQGRPATSRYPMPADVAAANAVALVAWGQWAEAAQLLVMEDCHLRPGEARGLLNEDLASP